MAVSEMEFSVAHRGGAGGGLGDVGIEGDDAGVGTTACGRRHGAVSLCACFSQPACTSTDSSCTGLFLLLVRFAGTDAHSTTLLETRSCS